MKRPEADTDEIMPPILQRPAMYFGTPNITAFFHFYMGLSYLGSISHRPLHVYKLKNDLFDVGGCMDWIYEKRGWSRAVCTAHLYCVEAANQLEDDPEVETFNEYMVEELGFALFVADYNEWRAQRES